MTAVPGGYSLFPFAGPAAEDRWRAREVDAIEALLRVEGLLDAPELKRRVEARRWGPGRFRAALAHAQREGRTRRVGRRRWEAVPR